MQISSISRSPATANPVSRARIDEMIVITTARLEERSMTTAAQLVTGVDFVPFSTKDIDKAIDFYGAKLGLPRSRYVPERNYAEFETGNVTLSLIDGEAMGIGHHVNRTAMALHVDDVAEARAVLEGRGVEFQGEIF